MKKLLTFLGTVLSISTLWAQCPDAPVADDWFEITDHDEQVVLQVTGTNIKFYSNSTLTNQVAGGSPWAIPTSDDGNFYIDPSVVCYYTLFVTQTENSCESEADEIIIEIIDCPVPRPNADSYVICDYDDIPAMEVVAGTWVENVDNPNDFEFRWFSEPPGSVDDTPLRTASTYTPSDDDLEVNAVNTWYVAQYSSEYNCMTTATVSITVNSAGDISLTIGSEAACEGASYPTISAEADGSVYWYDTVPSEGSTIYTGANYRINSTTYATPGEYTFYAVQYNNGCWSDPVSVDFEVLEKPDAPVVEPKASCSSDALQSLVMEEENIRVQWFNSLGTRVGTENIFTPTANMLDANAVTEFTVVYRDENGCTSDTGVAEYSYVITPLPPTISLSTEYEDGEIPLLLAEGCIVDWYTGFREYLGTGLSLDMNDNEIMPITENGSYTFIVNNTRDTLGLVCTSYDMEFTLQVGDDGYNVATGVIENMNTELCVYPNPAKDKVSITLGIELDMQVNLFDMNGHLLKQEQSTGSTIFNIADLPKGPYLLDISVGDGHVQQVLLKE